MSWLRSKLGFPKKDKENDPNISRHHGGRYSTHNPVWNNPSDLNASHRNSVATDWQKQLPLPPGPYSVETQPKTTKASRSCPGGSNGYSYQGHMKNHYQVPEAPIPPPRNHMQNSKLNETMQSEREHRYANISMHRSSNSNKKRQGYAAGGRGTSEYGSGSNDPSPIVYGPTGDRRSRRGRQRMVMVEANTSNSEFDSEAEEDQLTALMQACRRLQKDNTRLQRKRHDMKEHLNHQVVKHQHDMEMMERHNRVLQDQLFHERQKAERYEKEFLCAKAEIERLHKQLAMAREGQRHPVMNAVPGMTTVDSRSTITGAGEALCSRSTSNTDLANEEADLRIHSSSSATPPIQDDVYNEEDEVKNFRLSDDEDVMERPRTGSPENSDCGDFNGNGLAHHGSCVFTEDEDLQNANRAEDTFCDPSSNPVVIPRTPAVARSPLRRSYSETDVGRSNLTLEADQQEAKEQISYRSSAEPLLAEYSSSFSSDDEKARAVFLWQQLGHRGSVVCKPRRRNRVQARNFRSYGPNERSAMTAFDYLADLSTDISCMEATPGHSPDFC